MSFSPSAGALSNVIVDNENSLLVFFFAQHLGLRHPWYVYLFRSDRSKIDLIGSTQATSTTPIRRHGTRTANISFVNRTFGSRLE